MTDLRERTADLLADHPDAEEALRRLVERDAAGPWSFEDVAVDSGTFGEIVAAGVVEETDEGYELVDRAAVRAVLDGEDALQTTSGSDLQTRLQRLVPTVSGEQIAVVLGALVFVALVRVGPLFGSVFRDGAVVLPGNDPYYYRYWVTTLIERGGSPLDPAVLASLPGDVPTRDTLTTVGLWLVAAPFGAGAAPAVVAWYPPIAGVVSAALVYATVVRLTGDRRAGVGAIGLLAVVPAHAFRTAIGFGDHHALDYVWVAAMAYLTVRLATGEDGGTSLRRWGLGGALGLCVAGQSLSWRGAPLDLAPLAAVVLVLVTLDVAADRDPLRERAPTVVGLGLAGGLTAGVHATLGWMSVYVAAAPGLLAAGTVVVVAVGALAHRLELPAVWVLSGEVAVGIGSVAVAWVTLPFVRAGGEAFLRYMQLTTGGTIAETKSLVASANGSVIGPILFLGVALVLALPILVVETARVVRAADRRTVGPVVFGWYFLLLSLVQVRFAGQLGLFVALFGGIGFLRLAQWIGIAGSADDAERTTRPAADGGVRPIRRPDRRTLGSLVVLVLLVCSVGAVQSSVKMAQIDTSDAAFETARTIADDAERRGLTYPENYVWVTWGDSRMFNTFVNGRASSVEFAHANDEFLRSPRPRDWYPRMDERVGYVVVEAAGTVDPSDRSTYARLYGRHGSRSADVEGLGRFRLLDVSKGDRFKTFVYVPGAVVTGTANQTGRITVETDTTVDGQSFVYRRTAEVGEDGRFEVRVAYPGEYRVGDRTVTVTPADVEEGREVLVDETEVNSLEPSRQRRPSVETVTRPSTHDSVRDDIARTFTRGTGTWRTVESGSRTDDRLEGGR
ncbi:STT3 domain-containing protein [Halobaculum sp. MBLA0143]|uniref:STT3 domain-containing protein n=1 Tax=Halobaculum sp. MBLA0143 TaxID=3079933 RepID=UPI003523A7B5